MNINDFTKLANMLAVESKAVANEFASKGLRTDVTPAFVRAHMPDAFTHSGNLTEVAAAEIAHSPKIATINDFYNKGLESVGPKGLNTLV